MACSNSDLSSGLILSVDHRATVAITSSGDVVNARSCSKAGLAAGPMRPKA